MNNSEIESPQSPSVSVDVATWPPRSIVLLDRYLMAIEQREYALARTTLKQLKELVHRQIPSAACLGTPEVSAAPGRVAGKKRIRMPGLSRNAT